MLPVATLRFDGSCTVNPGGVMAYGWHIDTSDGRLAQHHDQIDGYEAQERTCNTAEFVAVMSGLSWLAAYKQAKFSLLKVVGDSQLAIQILDGKWKAKKPHLRELLAKCRVRLATVGADRVEFVWVPREQNREADRLSKLPASRAVTSRC
jgi:ribonuclease HI